jgi:hypothetical protein
MNDDYETHARSNESLRDSMDGKIEESRRIQSSEATQNQNNSEQTRRCDGSQSID